jgi:hypothetical protein
VVHFSPSFAFNCSDYLHNIDLIQLTEFSGLQEENTKMDGGYK